jgi:hypothetical protein
MQLLFLAITRHSNIWMCHLLKRTRLKTDYSSRKVKGPEQGKKNTISIAPVGNEAFGLTFSTGHFVFTAKKNITEYVARKPTR